MKTAITVRIERLLAMALVSCSSLAGDTNEVPSARASNKAQVSAQYAQQKSRYGTNADFFVRPGLFADRTGRYVRVYAETVHLNRNDPVEFPLIAENSGKDYESLAVAFAKPSDVHAALAFIGLPAGRSVDPSKLSFWPKGERVRMTFIWRDPAVSNAMPKSVPVEDFVIDTRTGRTLPHDGLVFTGSSWVTVPDQPATNKSYAADVFTPNAIAAVYNEPEAVLDVPRRAAQSEVYSYQVPNPDYLLPTGQLFEVRLDPLDPIGSHRVMDASLSVLSPSNSTGATLGDLRFELSYPAEAAGRSRVTNVDFRGLQAEVKSLAEGGRVPFVTITPSDSLGLGALKAACVFIDSIESETGIRVEAPPPGHPYYRAFLPNERYRERANRPIQPLELYLFDQGHGATGYLQRVEEEWKDGASAPTYQVSRFNVPTPDKVEPLIAAKKDGPAVLLVFAPPALTYGALRPYLAPALARNMVLYVFLPPDAKTAVPAGNAGDHR